MATLTQELVTQRAGAVAVAIQHSGLDNAPGENLWSATSSGPTNQTVTKDVAANQALRQDIDDRLQVLADAQ